MRPSLRRWADSIGGAKPLTAKEVKGALLPPIPLYRALLRAHRKLPYEMRSLGDAYVKDEFRRHRTTDNPSHIIGFLSQWKVYLDGLQESQGTPGKRLDPAILEKLSDQQVGQLHELLTASRDIWKPPSAEDLAAAEALRAQGREKEAKALESGRKEKRTGGSEEIAERVLGMRGRE